MSIECGAEMCKNIDDKNVRRGRWATQDSYKVQI